MIIINDEAQGGAETQKRKLPVKRIMDKGVNRMSLCDEASLIEERRVLAEDIKGERGRRKKKEERREVNKDTSVEPGGL